jgi:hypothetical protein
MTSGMAGVHASLGAIVWPVYLGACTGHPGEVPGSNPLHEPFGDINYTRGQITWVRQPDDEILGWAKIWVPAGVYTHYAFCSSYQQNGLMGSSQMPYPVVFDKPGMIHVDPIKNQDVLPRGDA